MQSQINCRPALLRGGKTSHSSTIQHNPGQAGSKGYWKRRLVLSPWVVAFSPIESRTAGCKNGDRRNKAEMIFYGRRAHWAKNQSRTRAWQGRLLDSAPTRETRSGPKFQNASTCGSTYNEPPAAARVPCSIPVKPNSDTSYCPITARRAQPEQFGRDPKLESTEPRPTPIRRRGVGG